MAEVRMALYRMQIIKQPAAYEVEAGLLSIWKNVSDPVLEMLADHIIPVFKQSRNFKVIIDRNYWGGKKAQWSLRVIWSCLLMDPRYTRGQGVGFLA
jgi:hypothetical protein